MTTDRQITHRQTNQRGKRSAHVLAVLLTLGLMSVTSIGVASAGSGGGKDELPAEDKVYAPGEAECGEKNPKCKGKASPATGLVNGDVVHIVAKGFTKKIALGIVQCVDPDDPDNGLDEGELAGVDCDTVKTTAVKANKKGKVVADRAVNAGPFGATNRVCDATHDCLLSITELTAGDAERVTFKITFA